MPTYTFPVQITLTKPLATAGDAQRLAAAIDDLVTDWLDDAQSDPFDPEAKVVVMQPVPGTHRQTTTDPD